VLPSNGTRPRAIKIATELISRFFRMALHIERESFWSQIIQPEENIQMDIFLDMPLNIQHDI
jgi:hypothetical protein